MKATTQTHLVIIIRLPTLKKMQNFLALNNRKGMYIDEIRKHDRPVPRQTAKQISLWVALSLKQNLFQKLGSMDESSFISDLNEYCVLNISVRSELASRRLPDTLFGI